MLEALHLLGGVLRRVGCGETIAEAQKSLCRLLDD